MYCCRIESYLTRMEISKDRCYKCGGIGAEFSTQLALLDTAIVLDSSEDSTEQIGSLTMTIAILISVGDIAIGDL